MLANPEYSTLYVQDLLEWQAPDSSKASLYTKSAPTTDYLLRWPGASLVIDSTLPRLQ